MPNGSSESRTWLTFSHCCKTIQTLSTAYNSGVMFMAATSMGACWTIKNTGLISITLVVIVNGSRSLAKIPPPYGQSSSIPKTPTNYPSLPGIPPAVTDGSPSSISSDLYPALPWMVTIHQSYIYRKNVTESSIQKLYGKSIVAWFPFKEIWFKKNKFRLVKTVGMPTLLLVFHL